MPALTLPRLRRSSRLAPVPTLPVPPGHTVLVPGRGEVFVRDTGGSGPVVLLLHGWMFASDLNWGRHFVPLARAGYRVLAVDLRGHGRGLRSTERFRLVDCADDTAGLLEVVGVSGALVVGYSLGGTVAQLLAHRHPARVGGLVLCATALDWSDPAQKALWTTMGGLRVLLSLFPLGLWRAVLRAQGADERHAAWVAAELSRSSARDVAEAGRELGRFDSSGWTGEISQPAAVVLMRRDRRVPPRKQAALAQALRVEPHVVDAGHEACATHPEEFVRVLLAALSAVRSRAAA